MCRKRIPSEIGVSQYLRNNHDKAWSLVAQTVSLTNQFVTLASIAKSISFSHLYRKLPWFFSMFLQISSEWKSNFFHVSSQSRPRLWLSKNIWVLILFFNFFTAHQSWRFIKFITRVHCCAFKLIHGPDASHLYLYLPRGYITSVIWPLKNLYLWLKYGIYNWQKEWGFLYLCQVNVIIFQNVEVRRKED